MPRPQRTDPFEINGMWFRVVPEELASSPLRKGKGHMILQYWRAAGDYPDGWHPGSWREVKMDAGFMMADFFFHEEHAMYERDQGFRGGYKYMDALWKSVHKGWDVAAHALCLERRNKATTLEETGQRERGLQADS